MKKKSITRAAAVLLSAVTAISAAAFTGVQTVYAGTFTPIMITQGNLSQTSKGVTFTLRHDYAHPYFQRTKAFGKEYDRMLVVTMEIKNQSGRPFNYTALMKAYDAAGNALVNANTNAACEFGALANGGTAEVTSIFLVRKNADLSSYTISYDHMDYNSQYFADMNQFASGLLTLDALASKYPVTPITFQIFN